MGISLSSGSPRPDGETGQQQKGDSKTTVLLQKERVSLRENSWVRITLDIFIRVFSLNAPKTHSSW